MAEDLAELTHSSDSSIDDRESPLSEQTALFIQKLNSTLGTCTSASKNDLIQYFFGNISNLIHLFVELWEK